MANEFKFDGDMVVDIPIGFTVLCDMDGTLVDTDYANYLSYRRALMEETCGTHDFEFADERCDRNSLKKRFPSLTSSQLKRIANRKSEYFKEFLPETRLNAALAILIKNYRAKNTMVLVTCCREKRAVEVLKHHKLLELFSRLICLEDLSQSALSNKYEIAITLLEVRKEAVFVFDNDDGCIEAAVMAGVPKGNVCRVFLECIKSHE